MVDVAGRGPALRRSVQLGRRLDQDYEVLAGLKPGEKVALRSPARGRPAMMRLPAAACRRRARFPVADRARLSRFQAVGAADSFLLPCRRGGTLGDAARGGSADRRAAGRRLRQLPRTLGAPRSSNSWPRRWRRCSIRSTASNTSTACRRKTRRSSPSASTSGQDRERSLVKLFKKLNENIDIVPPGVTGWVVKPVEIDDVPIVTLTLTGDATATPSGGSARKPCSVWRPCPTSRALCGRRRAADGARRSGSGAAASL